MEVFILNRKILTDEMKTRYIEYSPRTGEDDCIIYSMIVEEEKSKLDVSYELDVDLSTVYRALKRVNEFLNDESNWCEMVDMYYRQSASMIRWSKTVEGYKLAGVCLATFCTFGKEVVNKRFIRQLENMHRGIKNKKKELRRELLETHWRDVRSLEIIKIFSDIKYDAEGLCFKLTQEARDILLML